MCRLELTVILKHRSSFLTADNLNRLSTDVTSVDYEQLTIDKLEDPLATEDMLYDFSYNPEHVNTKVYLVSTVNFIYRSSYIFIARVILTCLHLVCTMCFGL